MRKHKVIELRHLTDLTFVIKMERNSLEFQTGQFVMLSCSGIVNQREYSIYSGENDEFLEVLVREVDGGKVSSQLKKIKPGTLVEVDGPFGFFKFNPDFFVSKKFTFIATGTGISPFHSFVKTYPNLDYQLIHGTRNGYENYEHKHYDLNKVTHCTSGDENGDFKGRVSDYLFTQKLDTNANYFLCGNSEMIYEAFDILCGKGIPVSNIYSEVYF